MFYQKVREPLLQVPDYRLTPFQNVTTNTTFKHFREVLASNKLKQLETFL